MVTQLWASYNRFVKAYPLGSMAVTTGFLMGAGDGISQLAIEKRGLKKYDVVRTGRFLVVGFCIFGPMLRGWYVILDRLYTGKILAPIKMMITDQMIMAPTYLATFFTSMGILKGEKPEEIKKKFKNDFFPILINGYNIWPAAQLVNFYIIPLQHRVLFVNIVILGWNTYQAWAAEK